MIEQLWATVMPFRGVLIGFFIFAVVYVFIVRAARRLDRVHKQIVHARRKLAQALIKRMCAADNAATFLPPDAAVLVYESTRQITEQTNEIGIDTIAGQPAATIVQVRARWAAESNLSAVLRTVFDSIKRTELEHDTASKEALEQLDAACDEVVINRAFHNTHVAAAREIRRQYFAFKWLVTGWTKPVATIDFDDQVGN